jgi:pimeloyl-ACP methyl ester carboxylesterase
MPYVETRTGRIHYIARGQGAPLLLLHATLHDHRDFDVIAPILAEDFRTIALDWPGHGRSDTPDMLTAGGLAATLADVVDGLALPPVAMIGNSVGGYAAARLALDHPNRVAGLVLVNSSGFIPQNTATRAFSRVLGHPGRARRLLPLLIRSYVQAGGTFDRALRDRVISLSRTRPGSAVAAAMWRSFALPEHDLRARRAEWRVPTLIVWGARDTAIPLRLGRATHRLLPSATFATMPTGHVPFASDPEGFLDLVQPFLRGLSLAARTGIVD